MDNPGRYLETDGTDGSVGFDGADRLTTVEVVESGDSVAVAERITDRRRVLIPHTRYRSDRTPTVGEQLRVVTVLRDGELIGSAAAPEQLAATLAGLIPEVRDGKVRMMSIARAAGVRAKVAVAATDAHTDPVAACVGRRASRWRAAVNELGGERLDFVLFDPDPTVYVANALAPAEVRKVQIVGGQANASVARHQMAAAVGSSGLNSRLAGWLVGMPVVVSAGA